MHLPEDPLFAGAGPMAARMRAKDWSQTPLGPSAFWPQSLRTVVRILLTSRYSMWMGWGPELCFLYNDAYRPTLGEKHDWALGRPAREVWAEIWGDIGPRIDNVLRSGEATWDEGLLLFLERSGYPEETYHTFSYSPLSDDADAIRGMLCVVTEVTDRVIGERRLALLRDLASGLAASTTEQDVFAAFTHALTEEARDLPFSITYLFDSGSDEARRVATTSIAPDHPLASTPEMWGFAELLDTGRAATITLDPAFASPTGPWERRPTHALVVPIAQQGQARPTGAFVAALNPHRPLDDGYRAFVALLVGQLVAALASARAYEEERRRAEALAEIDRVKTAFFSNVSHEFRTPLTLMLGPLDELISDAELAPTHRERLGQLQRNGERLLKLVNTMLEFSRIEAGRVQARYEPVDLAVYTADLASVFRAATDKAGLTLTVDAADLGEPAFVDRDMWEKIVLNLVSNAFKFTLAGEIEVALRRAGPRAVLTVRDTGTGIPADQLPHVFERFHRVEGSAGRSHEGTGIGLALVQELVGLHGGAVAVASELGRGTTFTVEVPLGREHLPQDRIEDTAQRAGSRHAGAFVAEALRWMPDARADEEMPARAGPELGRLLIADDNADMRDYVRRLFQDRWSVETVANGEDALRAIERRAPDVVITDVMMPVLDGFGLLAQLRGHEATRELPVILLSARAGEESRVEGLRAGASDYLVKPFSARELVARVEALLIRKRIRSAEEAQTERMSRVFAQAPVGVAILRGPTHVFESANESYLALIGERPVVGLTVREVFPELAGQGIYELLDGVYTTGEPKVARTHRLEIVRAVGQPAQELFVDFVYQPTVDAAGVVDGIAAVVFEVTELAQARRASEVANRAKDEFLAMLGHELRNPLAPILTALELMRLRGSGTLEREREVIDRQVRHLVGLVDDLLDVSRITQGKVELKRQPIELSDVVASAIEIASPLLERQRHQLVVDVPHTGLAIEADTARLAQVIANLLTNAAKYTPAGGRVRVEGLVVGADVVLRVRDTGIGIDPHVLPTIFEPFTQERQAIDRAQGGLGLGLAIVRSLIQLHGGSVAARSDGRGRGSEFELRIPRIASSHDVPRADDVAAPVSTAATQAPRVLVVDDNEDAALTLADALELLGYRTAVSHDGPSALIAARAFDPQIAILDIGLPVMDGFELARRFAGDDRLRTVRLIALTGYGQRSDREQSAAAGFLAHLVKPVDLAQLGAALSALVR